MEFRLHVTPQECPSKLNLLSLPFSEPSTVYMRLTSFGACHLEDAGGGQPDVAFVCDIVCDNKNAYNRPGEIPADVTDVAPQNVRKQ